MTVNDFDQGGDGGSESECDGQFHKNTEMVAALSTGWYNGGSRCFKKTGRYISITANGRTVNNVKVVDQCDSINGCDAEHAYQPPCQNGIVDVSNAVWQALGIGKNDPRYGYTTVTWKDV
jgi:hypothetical protein